MSDTEKSIIVNESSRLSKYFSIRLIIKVFGKTILDYQWPPRNEVINPKNSIEDE